MGLMLLELDERIATLTQAIQSKLRELDGLHADLREARAIRDVMLDKLEAEVMGHTKPRLAAALAEGWGRRRGKGRANG
ncbi:hypothetical protein J2847_006200 [Azospirillum agricola]|uniref:hypothetical protein n=1 Tax=Azospirillum agricola TaxID=1720247 RepID=UPI001AEAFDE9|nr:hypothetical protein [Azospirillum agricola]MBP2232866.1 hypothetical protein [Azospirillum agricola]